MLRDISRWIRSGMPGYPGDPLPELRREPDLERGGDYSFTTVAMHTHCGTHLDAPAHFIAGGKCIGDYPLEAFCPLVEVLDCRGLHDIGSRELEERVQAKETALLLKTDASFWEGEEYRAQHPGLTVDGAQYLLQRPARLLGIDYLSVERDGDGSFPVHRLLLGAGFLLLEHVLLARVEPGMYRLLCLPLKLDNAEAAPCRAVLTDAGLQC